MGSDTLHEKASFMTELTTAAIDTRDAWVEHPEGPLFARIWTPAAAGPEGPPQAPILLFHDSLGCVELWRNFPEVLSRATGRQVIAYDRLGFGRSAPRQDTLAMDFIAQEARSVVPVLRARLGFERFVALGHSVGGGMAVYCAAAFPEACEALVTIAAQAFPEDRTLDGILVAKAQFTDPLQVERLGRYHGDKARWVLDAWIETWTHPEFASWSLAETLPQVVCPVLAIHGAQDEYGSARHPEMIGALSSGPARVEIMPDTFHVPHREKPEAVVALVAGFLAPA